MFKFILPLLLALSLAGCRTQPEPQTSFSFGVVADIQYAGKDDSEARHYRSSQDRLVDCVDELNRHDLAFTIQLGDIIDGNTNEVSTLADLDRILGTFNTLKMPTYHVIGNHCTTAGREMLQQKLGLQRLYYAFTRPEAPGWRFIVLDGMDGGYGIVSEAQRTWLKATLDSACAEREKVIVFCHFPLVEEAASNHRMQEPEPVLQLIKKSGCVVAYFAGHDHAGGYAFQDGIHHVTLKGMLEAADSNAYAIIEVPPDRLKETGFGLEPNRELVFSGTR